MVWIPYRTSSGRLSAWTRVALRPPDTREHPDEWAGDALVDTGAELNHIPDMLAYRLGLRFIRKTRLLGMAGGAVEGDVYEVSLENLDMGSYLESVEVVATARNKIVLGMDYLKHFTLTLEGEAQRFRLEETRPRALS